MTTERSRTKSPGRATASDGLGELPDQAATLWFLIRRLAGLMDRQGEAMFRQGLGISLAQFLVLSVVDAHPGPLSQQAVADRLGLTKGTVSRQIDAAVRSGLMTAEVAEHTRREHALALTSDGEDLVRKGDDLFADSRAELLKVIDSDALTAVLKQLSALVNALEH
jgi:DNA-binding MarR family transcriptional regulator